MAVSDCIVIWGTNPVHTQVNVMTHVARARKERGAKLVVIDVYMNPTMKQADMALLLKPGTDGALACAVMHILFRDGLADWEYLDRYTDHPRELEAHLRTRDPAWAAGITGLSVDEIEAFRARFVAECDRLLPPAEEQKPVLEVDCACTLGDIASTVAVTGITRLAPFGRDNRKPLFLLEDVEISQVRVFGKTTATVREPQHLELALRQRMGARDEFMRVQWWGGAEHAAAFRKGARIDAVVEVSLSTYRKLAEVEARLVDIRPAIAVRDPEGAEEVAV
jgi:hypothetical protein